MKHKLLLCIFLVEFVTGYSVFGNGHSGQDLALILSSVVVASNYLLPSAVAEKSRSSSRKYKSTEGSGTANDANPVKSSVIDEMLKKAEVVKSEVQIQENSKFDLDPIKCWSSEVEQISNRKKNGLITEYLVLMKAVARHPEFLEDIVSKSKGVKQQEKTKPTKQKIDTDVANEETSSSDEEEENDDESSEDDEEEEDDDVQDEETPPNEDDDFTKAYLREKIEMENLFKETMQKEALEGDWDEGVSKPPSRRPFSSIPWNRLGNKNNSPQKRPWKAEGGGYKRPGFSSFFRRGSMEEDTPSNAEGNDSTLTAKVTSFFTTLFGFGDSSLTNDPWFSSVARDLSGEVAPGVAVDETREILETAFDIGKAFEKPSQCNEIFNACHYDYTELLYMIDDLRKNVRESVAETKSQAKKDSFADSFSQTDISSNKRKEKLHKKTKSKTHKKSSTNKKMSDLRRKKKNDENYVVIPVRTTPSSILGNTFSFPNVFSWFGVGSSSSL